MKKILSIIFLMSFVSNYVLAGPVIDAVKNNDIVGLKKALQNENVNEVDDEGKTALFWASVLKETEFVKILLEKGADPDIVTEHYYSPIMIATSHGNIEIVKILLAYKADTSVCNGWIEAPLIWAIKYGNMEMIKVLIAGELVLTLTE